MKKFEDILTGIMLLGSTLIVLSLSVVGVFFFLGRSNFIPLTILFAIGFLVLYTIRSIAIGISIILHGRYQDDMTLQENRR